MPILCDDQQLTCLPPSHAILYSVGYSAYSIIPRIIYEPGLLFREPFKRFEISDGSTLGKGFDVVDDLPTVLASLGLDRFVSDDDEFTERNEEEFLESRNGTRPWVRGVGVGRFSQ